MAQITVSDVQQSGEAGACLPRKPFVAPAVEDLGRLQSLTQLQFYFPP
ncbi:MAG TPA: hypothetical protein VEQ60_01775 [Longimicrobium sp.]|nr:hypothetical protein [Longimicrobium sp.]